MCFGIMLASLGDTGANKTLDKATAKAHKARLAKILADHKKKLSQLRVGIRNQRHVVNMRRGDMREIDRRIDSIEDSLAATEKRLADTRGRLRIVSVECSRATLAMLLKQEQFGRRLATIYKQGDSRFLTALIGTESVGDLASRSYILRRIANKDRQISDEYKRAKVELDRKRAEQARLVEAIKGDLVRQGRQEDALRGTLEEKRGAYQDALQTLSTQEDEYAEENAATKQIESELSRYYSSPSAAMVKPWVGSYIRPVPGPITSGYGYRFHPILKVRKLHTGIDIGAGHGTPIKAAAGGRIIKAEYYRGYGNCIIIDHGGGMATLYGHCSSLLVGVGQEVKQGQVVARVGSTGLATGPHLHFEVRRSGVPVSPR